MKSRIAITGNFIDEIIGDIPHQNGREKEWNADFTAMKKSIKHLFMFRAGFNRRLSHIHRGSFRP